MRVAGATSLLAVLGYAAEPPPLPLRGMSQSCAEWGQAIPGTLGKDYTFPDPFSIEHFVRMGFGVIRVPFLWERLQPALDGPLDTAYLGRLDETVHSVTRLGAHAIVDPHNYARYSLDGTVAGGQIIGANGSDVTVAHFADLWIKLALHFRSNPRVIFALMNEPRQMSTTLWAMTAQATVHAIREVGATQLILVPGNGWTGANSWLMNWYDTDDEQVSNAEAYDNFTDPGDNFAFEFHQYLDKDGVGSDPECDSAHVGVERVKATTAWLEDHNFTGFLGEFGTGAGDVCAQAVEGLLEHMDQHSEAWLGWAWWAAGPWWKGGPEKPAFDNIEPHENGTDRPQVEWLKKFITVLTQTTTTYTGSTTTSTTVTTSTLAPGVSVSNPANRQRAWRFWAVAVGSALGLVAAVTLITSGVLFHQQLRGAREGHLNWHWPGLGGAAGRHRGVTSLLSSPGREQSADDA